MSCLRQGGSSPLGPQAPQSDISNDLNKAKIHIGVIDKHDAT